MHTTDTSTNADTTEATAAEVLDTQAQAPSADRHAFTPITTQEDLDKVIGARLARERDKCADYDDLKAAASKLAAAEARLAQIDKGRTDRARIRARGGVEGASFGAGDTDAGGDPECLRS